MSALAHSTVVARPTVRAARPAARRARAAAHTQGAHYTVKVRRRRTRGACAARPRALRRPATRSRHARAWR